MLKRTKDGWGIFHNLFKYPISFKRSLKWALEYMACPLNTKLLNLCKNGSYESCFRKVGMQFSKLGHPIKNL